MNLKIAYEREHHDECQGQSVVVGYEAAGWAQDQVLTAAEYGEYATLETEKRERRDDNPDQRMQSLPSAAQRQGRECHDHDLDGLFPLEVSLVGHQGEKVGKGHPEDQGKQKP